MIKFRAWDKESQRMFNVARFDFADYTVYSHLFSCDGYLGENLEIMQSTGLKDKNSVEIYEGDVVNREKGLGIPHEIIFKNCEFKLVTPHSEESLGKTRKGGLIIVGNKYEHPHLLEE